MPAVFHFNRRRTGWKGEYNNEYARKSDKARESSEMVVVFGRVTRIEPLN